MVLVNNEYFLKKRGYFVPGLWSSGKNAARDVWGLGARHNSDPVVDKSLVF